jgi:hypothetical protein
MIRRGVVSESMEMGNAMVVVLMLERAEAG